MWVQTACSSGKTKEATVCLEDDVSRSHWFEGSLSQDTAMESQLNRGQTMSYELKYRLAFCSIAPPVRFVIVTLGGGSEKDLTAEASLSKLDAS